MDIIYHGSYTVVDEPSIIKGKYTKDFGYGFYCTRNKEQAEEWLDFVVHCRAGGTHDYDIVEGFMADDTIYEEIHEYLNGNIDKKVFLEMMRFKWSNNQISFHSARALTKIVFLENEIIK